MLSSTQCLFNPVCSLRDHFLTLTTRNLFPRTSPRSVPDVATSNPRLDSKITVLGKQASSFFNLHGSPGFVELLNEVLGGSFASAIPFKRAKNKVAE